MPRLEKRYLYRMTHIDNIPHILQYGLTHFSSVRANPNYTPIGDGSLITTRNNFILNNGRRLGEYIPFYFGTRTPMLYVIQNGFKMVTPTPASKIVYCVSSVQKIIDKQLDFVFTDGHAVNRFTSLYTMKDLPNIKTIIDWNAVKVTYWNSETDLDLKRRKEAEFLVLGDIAIDAILGFIVSDEETRRKLNGFGVDLAKILVKPGFYFDI